MTENQTTQDNPSKDPHETDTWLRGKDLWIRARTNALAHEVSSKRLKRIADYVFIMQTLFVVIPIVLISLSLQATTSEIQRIQLEQLRNPQNQIVLDSSGYKSLSLIAIVSNGFAFLLSILSTRFRWIEVALKHDELLAMYSLIAQKSRRLEDSWMNANEAQQFCRNLQELFETAKNRGFEPRSKDFRKAKQLMVDFNAYPFSISREEIKKISTTASIST